MQSFLGKMKLARVSWRSAASKPGLTEKIAPNSLKCGQKGILNKPSPLVTIKHLIEF